MSWAGQVGNVGGVGQARQGADPLFRSGMGHRPEGLDPPYQV